VKLHALLCGQIFGAFEDLACAFVGEAHFSLFLVGHGQDTEGKDFIDFRAVEEITRTFGRDLGVVVENDGRGQQRVAVAFLADQDGPEALVPAGLDDRPKCGGRIQKRDEFSLGALENRVRGDKRTEKGAVAIETSCASKR
jgi:hypothetical protein